MPASFSAFLTELRSVLDSDRISTDPDDLAEYGRDWTKVFEPAPRAVAFPRSTAEVSEILRRCNAAGVAVVPSGGRTGLAGGAVAANGELVLSLARLNALGAVDPVGLTVRVGAGAVTAAVHEHVRNSDYLWPVDFASKGSSQIGGNIATNAGGVNVIRYGTTRAWVLALEVVTMDGTVLELGGALEKNNTGLDLRQLFIGSEGILGVITAATLKLTPVVRRHHVVLFALDSLAKVVKLFAAARKSGLVLSAYEFFTSECLTRLLSHRQLTVPFATPYPFYALLQLDDAGDDAVEALCESALENDLAADAVVAQNAQQAANIWALREGISESLSATGRPHKNDVALPIAALEAFCADLETLVATKLAGWEICNFGHIGDGNLHINLMKPDAMSAAEFEAATHATDELVFELVQRHRGSISAEHGIGLLKRSFLHYTRSAEEIELMRRIKHIFDPKGLMNPGKVLPDESGRPV